MVILNAGNPGTLTGPGNNTYLFGGDEPTLIDAGVGRPAHINAIADVLGPQPLARVLLTHSHPDHASGVPALRERWPDVEVLAWPDLADAAEVRAGSQVLAIVHTPGHAVDHLCFWNDADRALYCGDMMTATTTVMVPPAARGGSLRDYLASLRRLAALEPAIAWPGHGDAIRNPVGRIGEYLAHRAEREAQVRACLADGVTDPDKIVERVYVETPNALWPAARLTVEALLEMLAEESSKGVC
jgi:glyoxylase-like metal-dependent hydrolase (beta-lactamase superfamily II)